MILVNKEAVKDKSILKQSGHNGYLVPIEIIEEYGNMVPANKRFMSENLAMNGIDNIYMVRGIKPPIFINKKLKPECELFLL